jgi:hypothetical protein
VGNRVSAITAYSSLLCSGRETSTITIRSRTLSNWLQHMRSRSVRITRSLTATRGRHSYAMAVFLELNEAPLKAPQAEATRAMLELAADTSAESRFREWVRRWVA